MTHRMFILCTLFLLPGCTYRGNKKPAPKDTVPMEFAQSIPPQKDTVRHVAPDSVWLKTADGSQVLIKRGEIYYHNSLVFRIDTSEEIIYDSPYNVFIERRDTAFVFITLFDGPDFDKMIAIRVAPGRALFLAKAPASEVGDRDHDGRLEFGGWSITEAPESYPDSIYYNPSKFYAIQGDSVVEDTAVERMEDIRTQGVHLESLRRDTVVPNPERTHGRKR